MAFVPPRRPQGQPDVHDDSVKNEEENVDRIAKRDRHSNKGNEHRHKRHDNFAPWAQFAEHGPRVLPLCSPLAWIESIGLAALRRSTRVIQRRTTVLQQNVRMVRQRSGGRSNGQRRTAVQDRVTQKGASNWDWDPYDDDQPASDVSSLALLGGAFAGTVIWILTMAAYPRASDGPNEANGNAALFPLLLLAASIVGYFEPRRPRLVAAAIIAVPCLLAPFTTPRGDGDGLWTLIFPMLAVLAVLMAGCAAFGGRVAVFVASRRRRP